MKKIYLVVVFTFCTHFIFSQLTFTSAPAVINYMSGHWTWIRSCGGLAGTCSYPSTVGYTRELVLSPVSSANDSIHYQLYQNNVLQKSVTVKVSTVATIYSGSWTLQDVTVSGTLSLSLSITNAKTDTLWLSDNCNDCLQHQYARDLTVGVKKITAENRQPVLFPNPVLAVLNFNFKKEDILSLQIFDMAGNLILKTANINSIDFSDYAQGVYFVQVKTPVGSFTEKLVKLNQ